jgi:enamine deaminase RidA (YjgF/YER057c/UK114 family)
VLENIKAVLEESGGSMENIVKLTVFIRNMEDFKSIHEVRARYFKHPNPACSMLEVSRMVSPDSLIEIEAIAAFEK